MATIGKPKKILGLPTLDTQRPYTGTGSNITGGTGKTVAPVAPSVPVSATPSSTINSGSTINRAAIDAYNANALKANESNPNAYKSTPTPSVAKIEPKTMSDNITKPFIPGVNQSTSQTKITGVPDATTTQQTAQTGVSPATTTPTPNVATQPTGTTPATTTKPAATPAIVAPQINLADQLTRDGVPINKDGTPMTPEQLARAARGNKSWDDINNDGIMNSEELNPERREAYDKMTPEEQKMMEDIGKALLNDQTQLTKVLANYVQQRREQKDYMTKQNEIAKQQQQIKSEIEGIQSSQRITDAQNKLDTLKRNTAYLGTGGQPGVSQGALDLASKQLTQAETVFSQLKNIENLMKTYGDLGIEFDANEFENQMDNLQDQLDNNVDKSVQAVFNQLSDPALAEAIDTPEEMNALRDKLYNEMDVNIKGYTDVANAQRQFLLETYNQKIKDKQEYIKQENTVNMDMSTAQGYYINGNGKPILNAQGGVIEIPQKPPLPPQLDLESGKLISYSIDKATGKIVADIQQILPPSESKALDLEKKRLEIARLKAEGVGTWSPTKLDDGTTVLVNNATGEVRGLTADTGDLQGAELAKTLASGKYNGKKFFGVYATGDPDGTQFASIYNKAQEQGLENYMASRQARGSKITVDMVNQASIATGIDPLIIAAKMAQDSGMGTQGKGARNNNPGNVGQFDSLDAKGITVKGYPTLEEGVLAVAENFKKRADALSSVLPKKKAETTANAADDNILYGLAKKLIETGGFEPKDVTALGYDLNDFKQKALSLYQEGKSKELESYGAKLVDPQTFLSADTKRKTNAIDALSQLEQIKGDISDYRDLIRKNGAELTSRTKAGDQLEQVKNSMALTLKEVKNLGVLNGKDYEILLTQIPDAISIKRWLGAGASLETLVDNFEKGLTDKVNVGLKSIGVQYGTQSNNTPTISSDRK